jgi:CPA1 family monovalent cation:H+ antiporter
MGFEARDGTDQQNAQTTENAVTVNALRNELLTAARDAVVAARKESGTDPTIVDLVLRRLDARGMQPE